MERFWLAALAALAAACTDLPGIDRGICGNRVIESGEDCDGAVATGTCADTGANACFFTCDLDAPLPGCPDGYRCGFDQRCRVPGGTFARTDLQPSYRFDVEDYRVGDVDGDGIGDVMGGDPRSIRVRFGSTDGDLATELDVATRLPTGPFEFTSFDGNATMDAVVPVGVGVFSLVSQGRALNPVAYSSIPLDIEQPVRMAAVEVMADIDSEVLTFDDRTMGFLGALGPRTALPGGFLSTDLAGGLAIGDLHRSRTLGAAPGSPDACPTTATIDLADEVALAFQGADRVFVTSGTGCDVVLVQSNTLSLTAPREVLLPIGSRVGPGGAFVGFFDGDGCPDILISTITACSAGTCDGLALAHGQESPSGQCSASLLPARSIFVSAGGRASQPFRLLATGDFDSGGDPAARVDDIVLTDRVLRTQCDKCLVGTATYGFGFLALAATPWAAAVVTDINRDGSRDVAARSDGDDDVDLLLGTPIGAFNKYKIDTAAPVVSVATGDFDGDLFLDVAIVERAAAADGGDVVSVSFGSPAGGPSPPVAMGSFGEVQLIAPLSSVADVESIDLASDLVVVADRRDSDLGDSRAAAVLLGDTSRRMVAPFLLRAPGDRVPDVPHATIAGLLDSVTGFDLAVIAAPGALLDTDSEPVGRASRLWMLRGDARGDIIESRVVELGSSQLPVGAFEPLDARYAVGELDSELPNEIVGIDHIARGPTPASQVSRLIIVRASATISTEVVDLPALGGVRSVRLADLDADGDVDLYATFGRLREVRNDPAPAAPLHILVLWNNAGTFDVAGALEVVVPGRACADVAPIQADADPPLELAILCAQADGAGVGHTMFVAQLDPASVSYSVPATGFRLGGDIDGIEVGDVDGDRIDDVVVHRRDTASLFVVRQCTSDTSVECSVDNEQEVTR